MEQITENPIDLEKYQIEPPFDPSLVVYFRKRLEQKIMKKINEMICQSKKPGELKDKEQKDEPLFLRETGIKLSEQSLDRPLLGSRQEKKTPHQDMRDRNAVEGCLSVCKRR